MKKLFLFAALFAAVTLNAKEIVIDLSKAEPISGAGTITPAFAEGVLTINWEATAGWAHFGVEIPLEELTDIEEIAYEYKGDGAASYGTEGVVLYPYLRDIEGNRWYKADYWPNTQEIEWQSEAFLPNIGDWDSPDYSFGEKAFEKFGFVAQPSKAGKGVFYLRNVKLTVSDATAVENVAASVKATKVVRDGQVLILRDGKTYNALGAEMK